MALPCCALRLNHGLHGRGALIPLLPKGIAVLDAAVGTGSAPEFRILSALHEEAARTLSDILMDVLSRFERQHGGREKKTE